ncbi:type III-B CRISPR module-associated protein Cmr5 [Acidilutibacter cellobiosedens]|jgi:CRISPR-associated protein Cmr5|uniref:CRISPR type III-B/RAMP module-associated protein Cmr5 n=1 Tax=Acidilutibacter cellobiosedens TaxID=2507161 RepID=A0A410QB01_9FIRM|nr:type III-B CRISPR module-associated protein Cmr5 [Acidilutibacter cellobiosedens]QAT61165.1 type III-B CRISPR module-associated protein Cmr5 [Acidilutibacter cellobiosedens]
MSIKNLNLEIAQFAMKSVLDSVKEMESCVDGENKREKGKVGKPKEDVKKDTKKNSPYKSLIKKIPVMVQKNGLINTLVFLFSKQKGKEYKLALNHFINWSIINPKTKDMESFKKIKLEEDQFGEDQFEKDKYKEYIKAVYGLSSKEYRILTGEMINLFVWLKRFADGVIEGDD